VPRRLLILSTVTAALGGCAGVQPAPRPGPSLEEALAEPEARVLWVGAHPDDESLVGSVLARACVGLGRPCALVVMNHGDGGECLRKEGCAPSLGEVRGREMLLVARAYGAELHHYDYFNAPLPVSSFPPRHELGRRWVEAGDPAARIEQVILRFKPTVVLTFDPNNGFTGHPEHQLASRFALAAVRRAAAAGHRVPHVYFGLNRFWMYRMFGAGDPATPTEAFDTHAPCGPVNVPCLDVALEVTRAHRTQAADMGRVRSLRPQLGQLYLRRVDPFDPQDAPDPLAE
jgi:LmbE family N-acetylglucosaminyl deacetylase